MGGPGIGRSFISKAFQRAQRFAAGAGLAGDQPAAGLKGIETGEMGPVGAAGPDRYQRRFEKHEQGKGPGGSGRGRE